MSWFSRDKKHNPPEDQKQNTLKQMLADGEAAEKVINDYGGVLGIISNMHYGAPESLLPKSKEEIKHAIKVYLLYSHLTKTLDEKFFNLLEAGYSELSKFMNDAEARNAIACQSAFDYAMDPERTAEDAIEEAKRLSSDAVKAALTRRTQSLKEYEALMYEFNAIAKKIGIPYAKTPEQVEKSIKEALEFAKHAVPRQR